jgi:hypothetical protein
MSSPKTAAAKTSRRPKSIARPAGDDAAGRPTREPAAAAANADAGSDQAKRLAAEIEHALASGRRDVLSAEALQALMAAVCKTYAAQVEAGEQLLPLPARGGATATDVMITASGLLKAANLAVFELGMWQSWSGR